MPLGPHDTAITAPLSEHRHPPGPCHSQHLPAILHLLKCLWTAALKALLIPPLLFNSSYCVCVHEMHRNRHVRVNEQCWQHLLSLISSIFSSFEPDKAVLFILFCCNSTLSSWTWLVSNEVKACNRHFRISVLKRVVRLRLYKRVRLRLYKSTAVI